MKTNKKTPRRWRLNYVITYLDSDKAEGFRHFVHDILISVATLRKIDYAIEVESSIADEMHYSHRKELQGIVADMFLFPLFAEFVVLDNGISLNNRQLVSRL